MGDEISMCDANMRMIHEKREQDLKRVSDDPEFKKSFNQFFFPGQLVDVIPDRQFNTRDRTKYLLKRLYRRKSKNKSFINTLVHI